MSKENNWQFELEEYIRQGEPEQAEKSEAWQIAIGLQQVDGLNTSDYLLDTAKEHIEGKISIDEVQKRIQSYYEERTDRNEVENETKEADIVSTRIAQILGEKTFQFSPAEWKTIHRRLFEGVFSHAGQIRTYNKIYATTKYLELFFSNLLMGTNHELKNRYMHVDYVVQQIDDEVQRAINDVSKGNFCPLDCTLDEWAILKILIEEPNITQHELAQKIGKSERTIKSRIASLKEKGYVQRMNGKRNGRWEVLIDVQVLDFE